jgi:hypothetical protein
MSFTFRPPAVYDLANKALMIAISYRRDDSLPVAGRLYDRLEQRFGKENVFMDFDACAEIVDDAEAQKKRWAKR